MAKKIEAWWSDISLIAHALVQCDVLGGREFERLIKAEAERLARDRAETKAIHAAWVDAMRDEDEVAPPVERLGSESWLGKASSRHTLYAAVLRRIVVRVLWTQQPVT